jgi:hypothetical protein
MIRKNLLRSAGLAAGLLGLVALAPSAYAQYWNGAPNATGPNGSGYMTGPGYMYSPGPGGPNYGGAPGYGGNAAGQSYWLGAPNATGPGY